MSAGHSGTGLFSPEFMRDPYPFYAELRSSDPVYWDETLGRWLLSSYSSVATALSDRRFVRGVRGNTPEEEEAFLKRLDDRGQSRLRPIHSLLAKMMLFSDPPKHTRLRSLVTKAFVPRVVVDMRPRIQAIVDSHLDAVEPTGEFDVIGDLAYPLPITVICEMLSLPERDRAQFKRWSDDIIAFSARVGEAPEVTERALQSRVEIADYFQNHIAHLREHPNDTLMSALVAAEEEGDQLTEEELIANAILLLMNGHETTTFMIGNGLLALLHNPDQLHILQEDPALITPAVEELLRYDGSVQVRGLGVAQDLELDGKLIRQGEGVMALIGSANRDPEHFADPENLDIGRPSNRHVEFGWGIHFCVGAALARTEIQIAIGSILQRIPNVELVSAETIEWQPIPIFRGPRALPVSF